MAGGAAGKLAASAEQEQVGLSACVARRGDQGAGSRTVGMAGVAWSPAVSTTARRLLEVGAWSSKLAKAVLGRLGVGRRRGRWLAGGQVDRLAQRDRRDARKKSPLGRQLAATTLGDHCQD